MQIPERTVGRGWLALREPPSPGGHAEVGRRDQGGSAAWQDFVWPSTSAGRSPTSSCSTRTRPTSAWPRSRARRATRCEGVHGRRGGGGVDLADVTLFSHGTTVATNALITRRFPPAAMVTTRGLPRRARDPARHEGRPVGRLQGRRAALHPPPRPLRGHRAHRLRGQRPRAARRGRGAHGRRAPAGAARSRPSRSASSTPTPTPRNEHRMREILEEELPGVFVSTSSEIAAGDLRVRALLDHRRQRGALAAGRRLRPAARRAS